MLVRVRSDVTFPLAFANNIWDVNPSPDLPPPTISLQTWGDFPMLSNCSEVTDRMTYKNLIFETNAAFLLSTKIRVIPKSR